MVIPAFIVLWYLSRWSQQVVLGLVIYIFLRYLYVMARKPLCTETTSRTDDRGNNVKVSYTYVYRGITGITFIDRYLHAFLNIGLGDDNSHQYDAEIERILDKKRRSDEYEAKQAAKPKKLGLGMSGAPTASNQPYVPSKVSLKQMAAMVNKSNKAPPAAPKAVPAAFSSAVAFPVPFAPSPPPVAPVVTPKKVTFKREAPEPLTAGELQILANASGVVKGKTSSYPMPVDLEFTPEELDVLSSSDEKSYTSSSDDEFSRPMILDEDWCVPDGYTEAEWDKGRKNGDPRYKNESPFPRPMQQNIPLTWEATQQPGFVWTIVTKCKQSPRVDNPFIDIGMKDVIKLWRADGSDGGSAYPAENRIVTINHNRVLDGSTTPEVLYGSRPFIDPSTKVLLKHIKTIGRNELYEVPMLWSGNAKDGAGVLVPKLNFGRLKPCPDSGVCMIVGFPQNPPFGKQGELVASIGNFVRTPGTDLCKSEYSSDFGMSGAGVYIETAGKFDRDIIGTHEGSGGSLNEFRCWTQELIDESRPKPKNQDLMQQIEALKAQIAAFSLPSPIDPKEVMEMPQRKEKGRGKNKSGGRGQIRAVTKKMRKDPVSGKTGFVRTKFFSTKLNDWVDYGEMEREYANFWDYMEHQADPVYQPEDPIAYKKAMREWMKHEYGDRPNYDEYPQDYTDRTFWIPEEEDLTFIHSVYDEEATNWEKRERVKGRFVVDDEDEPRSDDNDDGYQSEAPKRKVALETPMTEKIFAQMQKLYNISDAQLDNAVSNLLFGAADTVVEAVFEGKHAGVEEHIQTQAFTFQEVKTPSSPKETKGKEKEAPMPVLKPKAVKGQPSKTKIQGDVKPAVVAAVASEAFPTAGAPSRGTEKRRCPHCLIEQINPPAMVPMNSMCPKATEFGRVWIPWNILSSWSKAAQDAYSRLPREEKEILAIWQKDLKAGRKPTGGKLTDDQVWARDFLLFAERSPSRS